MTPTPAADPVGPQHDEDDYSAEEVRLIIEENLGEIQRNTLDYDPYA